jgi:uncharacterized membrane protein YvbJ
MRHIPKSAMSKREGKVRTTLRSTLSSMKSILGNLKTSKTEKYKEAQAKKKKTLTITAAIAVIILIIIIMVVALR